jgi:uncharacterized protein (DUF2141 family)
MNRKIPERLNPAMTIVKKPLILIILLFFILRPSFSSEPKGSVELTITQIRNDKGWIIVSLFDRPQGFPADSAAAIRYFIIEAQPPSLNINVYDLPASHYAIAIIHDENQNMELDTNFMGAPTEGFASSGSNRRFSAPKFESSKFKVHNQLIKVEIEMNYLF